VAVTRPEGQETSRMRTLTLAVLSLFIAGCAAVGNSPPAARIDDVVGKAVSYCWDTQCVDGFPSADAPLVRGPDSLRLEQVPTELQVFVRRGDGPNFQQQAVAVTNGRLGALPTGDWDYVLAMARFSSGSAMYAWRLK
jgi:hypothetical protein